MEILVRRDGAGRPVVARDWNDKDAFIVTLSNEAVAVYCGLGNREKSAFLENYLALCDSNRAVLSRREAEARERQKTWRENRGYVF